jgi:hypothetical protein
MISAADFDAVLGVASRPRIWSQVLRLPEAPQPAARRGRATAMPSNSLLGLPSLDTSMPQRGDGEWAAG